MDKPLTTKMDSSIADVTNARRYSNDGSLARIASGAKPSWISRPILLASIFTIADVLIVSRFQPPTAVALLRYTPPLTLLLGAFVNIVPVLVRPVLIALMFFAFGNFFRGRVGVGVGYALMAVFLYVIAACLLPLESLPSNTYLTLVTVVGGVLLYLYRDEGSSTMAAINRTLGLPGGKEKWVFWAFFALLSTVWALIGLSGLDNSFSDVWRSSVQQPYVPAELIQIAGEQQSVVGYVIDVDSSGQWTTILIESDRTVRVYPSEAVLRREVCATAGLARYRPKLTTFLADAEPDSAAFPKCPRADE